MTPRKKQEPPQFVDETGLIYRIEAHANPGLWHVTVLRKTPESAYPQEANAFNVRASTVSEAFEEAKARVRSLGIHGLGTGFAGFAGRGGGLTLSDIEQWIDNDEGLYNWWKTVGGSKRDFIRKYRAELEEAIENVTSGRKRQHYLQYDKPKKPPGGWSGLGGEPHEDELLARLDVLIRRAEQEVRSRGRRNHAVLAIRAAGNLFMGVEDVIENTGAKPSEELTVALRVLAERLKNAAGSVGVPMPPLALYTVPKPPMHGLAGDLTPLWRCAHGHTFHKPVSGNYCPKCSMFATRADARLVYDKSGEPVKKGDIIRGLRVLGWRPPHKPGSTGRVIVKEGSSEREFYPTVIDAHWVNLEGLGADLPGKPRMLSLKALLPQDALDSIERRHAAGLLTIRELKDICHKYATHLDAKGVDPTYLAYFIAHALGVRR